MVLIFTLSLWNALFHDDAAHFTEVRQWYGPSWKKFTYPQYYIYGIWCASLWNIADKPLATIFTAVSYILNVIPTLLVTEQE